MGVFTPTLNLKLKKKLVIVAPESHVVHASLLSNVGALITF